MEEINQIETDEITERDNLAVVGVVESLTPIAGKDRIELLKLRDVAFTFICEKIHKPGDKVVYVKYDTVVPDNELFSFMKDCKFRVKAKAFTEKDEEGEVIGKIYSQGIVLPIEVVINHFYKNHVISINCTKFETKELVYRGFSIDAENIYKDIAGEDWTNLIGIKKYIPPVSNSGGTNLGQLQRKGDFPTHIISKTDELNCASKPRALEELNGLPVYLTTKIDGSSLTVFHSEEEDQLIVCSRNLQLKENDTNKFWLAVNKYNLKEKMKTIGKDYVLQGEVYGIGIQKNRLKLEGVDLAVFNVSNKQTRQRLGFYETKKLLEELEVPMVTVIRTIQEFNLTFDDLQKIADDLKYPSGELAEGIVIRPYIPFYSKIIKDIWSMKVMNRDFY